MSKNYDFEDIENIDGSDSIAQFASPKTGEMLRKMVYGNKAQELPGRPFRRPRAPSAAIPAGIDKMQIDTDVLLNMTFKQNTALMHEVMKQLLEQYNTISCEEAEIQLTEFTRLAATSIIEEQKGIPSRQSKSMQSTMAKIKDTVQLVDGYRAGIVRYDPRKGMLSAEDAKKLLHRFATAANLQWTRENAVKITDARSTKEGTGAAARNNPSQTTVMDILIVEETALMLARKLRCAKEQPKAPAIPSFEDLYPLIDQPLSALASGEKKESAGRTTKKEPLLSQSSKQKEEEVANMSPQDILEKLSNFASLVTKQTFDLNVKPKTPDETKAASPQKRPDLPGKEEDKIAKEVLKRYEQKFNILINSSLRITGDKHAQD
jgi:hypothetical protein